MIFSLIIVNYNTKELFKNCLSSVLKHRADNELEIIVVDNNSSDGSAEIVRDNFPEQVRLIVNNRNIGFGPANNQGAKLARGEFLFFLNSDTIIEKNIFPILKEIFSSRPRLAVAAPRLFLPTGAPQPYAFGQFPNLARLIKRKFNPAKSVRLSRDVDLYPVDWVSGAAMAIRKSVFSQIGGFDEKFFMYFEDIDLCRRAKRQGWQVAVCPQVSLTHFVGQSAGGLKQRKKYYYQSQDYFFQKYYGRLAMRSLKAIRWPYKKILGI